MNVLVTAGNTQAPIDQVRCITNTFSGRTGTRLAVEAYRRGGRVTLLTSRPEAVQELGVSGLEPSRWRVHPYRTFDELQEAMRLEVASGVYDVILHSAAVSDYLTAGVFIVGPGARFDPEKAVWESDGEVRLEDVWKGKVKGSHPELWVRLVPAPKLVDQVRRPWNFGGVLVKFKLEVDVGEVELLRIAEVSREHSGADLMVANTLSGMREWALVGAGEYAKVSREALAGVVMDRVMSLRGS